MVNDFDVVIIGGGIVGLTTALALCKTNINIAIVDVKENIYQTLSDDQMTIRASAINLASKNYFEQINIWKLLENSQRVLSFDSIDVVEKQAIASLQADSTQYHGHHLGYIIENQLIQNVTYQQIQNQSNIHFFHDSVKDIFFCSDRGFIEFSNGKQIAAKLIVAADGANSFVRQKLDIKLIQYPYRHQAIIATVKTELAHQACARQIFYPNGIIAFLPLWQPNMSCLVWSAKPDEVNHLQLQSDNAFNDELVQMTDSRLGRCELVSKRLVFPLTARYCPKPVQNRLILIGDAAHTIHPLAGQGVNLGLEDSQQLTDIINKNYLAGKDIGLTSLYHQYQLNRHKDTLMMLGAMQMIQETFNGSSGVKKLIRGVGMNLINGSPFIKQHLIKYALGL